MLVDFLKNLSFQYSEEKKKTQKNLKKLEKNYTKKTCNFLRTF